DAESVALLESYLDRRFPAWREDAQGDAAGGQRRPPPGGKMTAEEAYQILGLQPGAGHGEIGRAHRALMKKLHPDQGGSTYLAPRKTEEKDPLLKKQNGTPRHPQNRQGPNPPHPRTPPPPPAVVRPGRSFLSKSFNRKFLTRGLRRWSRRPVRFTK